MVEFELYIKKKKHKQISTAKKKNKAIKMKT